jgi:hypothetical protein
MAGSRLTVEAVIVRADGTREDLGIVASNDPAAPGDAQHPPAEDDEGTPDG